MKILIALLVFILAACSSENSVTSNYNALTFKNYDGTTLLTVNAVTKSSTFKEYTPHYIRYQGAKKYIRCKKSPCSFYLNSGLSSTIASGTIINNISTVYLNIEDFTLKDIVTPRNKDELKDAIANRGNETDLNYIDTRNIKDMSEIFNDDDQNIDVSLWNTENVTNMKKMFKGASNFNNPLNTQNSIDADGNSYSAWDTSKVTDMSYLFYDAKAFNQHINRWNTKNVTDMSWMFSGAAAFNQGINTALATVNGAQYTAWDTSKVTTMNNMFSGDESPSSTFNQPLNRWNTENVTDMRAMFSYATNFNQNINTQDVTVNSVNYSAWNLSKVTDIGTMFKDAKKFNQPLEQWNTSKVLKMNSTFQNAESFNQDISKWTVGQVTTYRNIFDNSAATDAHKPSKFR